MEFSRQENWSGLPFPSPEDLLNPGINPWPPALQADSLSSEPPGRLNLLYGDKLDKHLSGLWRGALQPKEQCGGSKRVRRTWRGWGWGWECE